MRGRKPIPTEVHKQRGTFNPTKHGRGRKHAVKAGGVIGPPPDWLTEQQQQIYREVVAGAPIGLLKAVDGSVLIAWVTAYHTLMIASQTMGDTLPVLRSARRSEVAELVRHPLEVVRAQARRDLIKAASELGFSPASRARIPEPPESLDDDEGEAFFNTYN
jgi:P27 family predicted phage terminase small subunit